MVSLPGSHGGHEDCPSAPGLAMNNTDPARFTTVTVTFSRAEIRAIEAIAEGRGIDIEQAVRECLGLRAEPLTIKPGHLRSIRPTPPPTRPTKESTMPMFEVQIVETSRSTEGPVDPRDPTPVVRMVMWLGEAENEELAKGAAYCAWDEKYGPGQRPAGAVVKVSQVDKTR